MLRSSGWLLGWRAKQELWRARPALRGRAKYERSLGVRAVTLSLSKWTRFRTQLQRYNRKAVERANIDSAVAEHGSGWAHFRNDLCRQNIQLFPSMQRHLALYEPLAFRSLTELLASHVAPPPSMAEQRPVVPVRAYQPLAADNDRSTHMTSQAEQELRDLVSEMLAKPSTAIHARGTAVDAWVDSWKEFVFSPSSQTTRKTAMTP